MGLDVSHDCFTGAYSAFHRWRTELARAMGVGDIMSMEGYTMSYGRAWPENDPLVELLTHSDCEGSIPHERCEAIAARLEELLPAISKADGGGHLGYYQTATQRFIDGLRRAAAAREDVEFY